MTQKVILPTDLHWLSGGDHIARGAKEEFLPKGTVVDLDWLTNTRDHGGRGVPLIARLGADPIPYVAGEDTHQTLAIHDYTRTQLQPLWGSSADQPSPGELHDYVRANLPASAATTTDEDGASGKWPVLVIAVGLLAVVAVLAWRSTR